MSTNLLRLVRLLFGLLGLSSVLIEIIALINSNSFEPFNFVSYFTIIANTAAGIFLIFFSLNNAAFSTSRKLTAVRGAATLYMVMTGIIFAILLAGIEGATLTAVPWDNIVLHYVIPIFFALDWLVNPPMQRISYRVIWIWALLPATYVMYSLLRGAVVNWYPYPFLNPTTSSYTQVIATSLILSAFVIILSAILIYYSNRRLRSTK